MGKIINMQDKYNEILNSRKKPKLNTNGLRKIKLLKPGIEKEYSLTRSQKRYARIIRGTTLGIAALAAATSIGFVSTNYVSNNISNTQTTYETDNETLDRNIVFEDAKEALSNIVLPNGSRYSNAKGLVDFPTRDEYRNINSVRVRELVGQEYIDVYNYNVSDNELKKQNPEKYNEFIEKLIEVSNEENPSQKTLQELKSLTDEISKMNLSLEGNRIVNSKEIDNER